MIDLAAAGARWRADLDDDPSLDELFARATGRRGRRRAWAMLAAAAVVATIGVGAAVVAAAPDARPPEHARASACADEFQASLTPRADTEPTAEVRLRYIGDAPCEVGLEITRVDLVRAGAADLVAFDGAGRTGPVARPVRVRPGAVYDSTLTWRAYCAAQRVTAIRFHLRGGAAGIEAPIGAMTEPGCGRSLTLNGVVSVTGLIADSDSARLALGIRFVGGPSPGLDRRLQPGALVVAIGSDPYRTATTPDGGRTTVVVAPGRYRVSVTSASCRSITVTVAAGDVRTVTVRCEVE